MKATKNIHNSKGEVRGARTHGRGVSPSPHIRVPTILATPPMSYQRKFNKYMARVNVPTDFLQQKTVHK